MAFRWPTRFAGSAAIPTAWLGRVTRRGASPPTSSCTSGKAPFSTTTITSLWDRIHAEALEIAKKYDTTLDYVLQHTNDPALSDPRIRAVIADAVAGLRLTSQAMPSGAGHDAQDLARIGPMGMIF